MDINCHHCGSLETEYKFHIKQHPLYQCPACQLAFLYPQPTDQQLNEIYNKNYFIGSQSGKEHLNRLKKETAQLYLDELLAYTSSSNLRLLEIGSGNGDFIIGAQKRGFDVTGIEVNDHAACAVNEKLGGEFVIQGTLDSIDLDALGKFDVCVLFDVIEHVRDLTRLMTQIRHILKEDSILFIVTPSLDSWSAKMLKSNWMEFKPEHLFYFNTQNLETFLIKSGFQNIATSPNYKILNFEYIHGH
ncbi:MAG: class I SAM-dependent methyltransferase, partial [SAR324 cluster bacterium]|nr:class I SAM-dependent methyltransferase [SAR324 cluster bacterium]